MKLKNPWMLGFGAIAAAVTVVEVQQDHRETEKAPLAEDLPDPSPKRVSTGGAPREDARKSPSGAPLGDEALAGRGQAMSVSSISAFLRQMRTGARSEEEQMAFWKEIEDSKAFEELVESFEEEVAGEAWSADRQLELAQLYLLKLSTVPTGPLKGLWAGKAQEVWEGVLAVDPTHWEAQHQIAVSLSRYPDFLDKRREAIAAYERLIGFPETGHPAEWSIRAHMELAALYQKEGRPVDVLRTIESGLEKHPENPRLHQELETLRSQYVFEDAPEGP